MKQKILKSILILVVSISYGQKKETKTVDWQNLKKINSSGITSGVRNGDFAIFEINNINKFLFQVTIAGETIDLQTEMSDEMRTLFRIPKSDEAEKTNNDEAEKSIENAVEGKDKMSSVESSTIPITATFTAADNLKLKATVKNVVKECETYIAALEKISDNIGQLKINRVELVNLAKQDLSFKEMKRKVSNLTINSNAQNDYINFETVYKRVKLLYKQAIEEAKNANQTTNTEIANALALIVKSYEQIEEEEFLLLYKDVKYLSDELNNEKNFTVTAPPVQMADDLVNYVVSITPINTNTLAPYNSKMEFSFDIPSNSGLEVDFSVGPTVSLGKNAKDEKYFLESSTTTIGNSILRQRDNNNSGTPGLAAIMHFYDRVANETAIGGLFGVGAGFQTIDDVDLSFYIGGTVVLGKKQKVMLNAGLSFLRVDRIKDKEYVVGNEYTTLNFDVNNVVEKVFKSSFFISLSYNITKRVN